MPDLENGAVIGERFGELPPINIDIGRSTVGVVAVPGREVANAGNTDAVVRPERNVRLASPLFISAI